MHVIIERKVRLRNKGKMMKTDWNACPSDNNSLLLQNQ